MSEAITALDDGKIGCMICASREHTMAYHLKKAHPEVTIEAYQEAYPNAALYSEKAAIEIRRMSAVKNTAPHVPNKVPEVVSTTHYSGGHTVNKEALHEVFGLGAIKAAMSRKGTPIQISKITASPQHVDFVPDIDVNYIFPIAVLKKLMLAVEMNMPAMCHGHAGVGKTTVFEQIAARTGRPTLRVQHTNNMEESHVLGGWRVKDGATFFELGPLPFAMKYGLMYIADEYDRARPGVLALYQPVLEGKPLVIKEADPENRVIKPHPLFRIVATGNTNGTGDESGLYQGTIVQDAANYERFGMVVEVGYMDKKMEVGVVAGQGGIPVEEAEKLVDFARAVRESFTNGKIGLPISPRALINAAKIALRVGSLKEGLDLSYTNRLSRIDKETVSEVLNRMAIS